MRQSLINQELIRLKITKKNDNAQVVTRLKTKIYEAKLGDLSDGQDRRNDAKMFQTCEEEKHKYPINMCKDWSDLDTESE